MLKIGEISNELDARTFGDYLYVQGVESQIDPNSRGAWDIWIIHEKQVAAAEDMLARFKAKPDDPVYNKAASGAGAIRKEAEKRDAQAAVIRMSGRWRAFPYGIPGGLTLALMAISVTVAVYMMTAHGDAVRQALSIATFNYTGGAVLYDTSLHEVRSGQVWRLITPIFIHFGLMHIFFNMIWMRDLGGAIERKEGTLYFGILILAASVISNLGQFYVGGPTFGGMSGVNYALFGFAWIRGRFDPSSGYAMHRSTVTTMIAWYFLCLTGLLGPIANAAHSFGFALGIVWGFVSARLVRRG